MHVGHAGMSLHSKTCHNTRVWKFRRKNEIRRIDTVEYTLPRRKFAFSTWQGGYTLNRVKNEIGHSRTYLSFEMSMSWQCLLNEMVYFHQLN